MSDLGLYLGSAETPAPEFLGRNVTVLERPRAGFWLIATGVAESSEDVVPASLTFGRPGNLRVPFDTGLKLASGDELFSLEIVFVLFSMAGRPVGMRLPRFDDTSLVLLVPFSFSVASLCITSANALPTDARFSVCRIEFFVVWRGRRTRPVFNVGTSAVDVDI